MQKKLLTIKLFETSNNHFLLNNHFSLLIKAIIEMYMNLRFHYVAKLGNEKNSIRSQYTKLILFKGM